MEKIHLTTEQLIQYWCGSSEKIPTDDELFEFAATATPSPLLTTIDPAQRENISDEFVDLVDEILWLDWDPIGVNGIDECRDEYSTIVNDIALATRFGSVEQLAAELFFNEKYYLGMDSEHAAERSCSTAMILKEKCEINFGVATTC